MVSPPWEQGLNAMRTRLGCRENKAWMPWEQGLNAMRTRLGYRENKAWIPWEKGLDAMNRLCTQHAGREWIVRHCRFVAGRGPCGRPHPMYVIIVISGYVCSVQWCLRMSGGCGRPQGPHPAKRTAQHLEIGSYITSEIEIGSYIRNRNWKLHQR